METGEISYEISVEDFTDAQRLNYRRSLSTWRTALVFVIAIVVAAALAVADDGTIEPWSFGLAMLFALFVFLVLPWLLIPRSARRMWAQRKTWSEVRLGWDSDQVWLKAASGDGHFKWNQFYRWAADKKMMLLYIDGRLFYMIPTRALPSAAQDTIVGYLTSAGIPRR